MIKQIIVILMLTFVFTIGFMFFDILFSSKGLYDFFLHEDTVRYICSSIFQGFAALVGILGSFLIFYSQIIRERMFELSRDVIAKLERDVGRNQKSSEDEVMKALINKLNETKTIGDFISDLREIRERVEVRSTAYSMENAELWLNSLMKEQNRIKDAISMQFMFLFLAIIASFFYLNFMDLYYRGMQEGTIDIVTVLLFKLSMYVLSAFSISAIIYVFYTTTTLIYRDQWIS